MKKQINVQDIYLNNLRQRADSVNVFLQNGIKLQGVVKGFDNFTVVLEYVTKGSETSQTLVYKNSIISIAPSQDGFTPIRGDMEQNGKKAC